MKRTRLDTDQKALEINLNPHVYGTFAEIGAGQEVARHFFKVGGAVGTIAKTMSAYDKVYSDDIYGVELSGRYVCESRVYKMLDHEYRLMEERLQDHRPDTNFFVFADSVTAINYSRTVIPQGWLGLRFQLAPDTPPNDMVIHVRMLDSTNLQQQDAIGILGVNLIYACIYHYDDMEDLVCSLIDELRDRVVIDMIRLTGPDFEHIDNRSLALLQVQNGLTDVAMFGPDGMTKHASEFLYKKHLMVVRGTYRPPTLVSEDVFERSFEQFKRASEIEEDAAHLLAEITLTNLMRTGEISEKDFLARAKCLNAMGKTVIVSNCLNHQQLINYLADYKIKKLGLVIGVRELEQIIREKYERNQDGRLLVAFGELFTRNIKIYVYPAKSKRRNMIVTADNMDVPDGIRFLYKHLLDSEQIVNVSQPHIESLDIYGWEVLEKIMSNNPLWKKQVPASIIDVIEKENLFAEKTKNIEFEF